MGSIPIKSVEFYRRFSSVECFVFVFWGRDCFWFILTIVSYRGSSNLPHSPSQNGVAISVEASNFSFNIEISIEKTDRVP